MRDLDRIEPFMLRLGELWKENFPDWRFTQFILNFIGWYGDPFYLEESSFLRELETFIQEIKSEL